MKSFKEKIKSLGGVDFLKEDLNTELRGQLIAKENPGNEIIDLIDEVGFGMFNETIEYDTIEKVPVAGSNNKCGIESIYGWGNSVHGVQWHLVQLQEEDLKDYFPFAAGYPGDCICIATAGSIKGKIHYWSHDDGAFYLIANSLQEFIMTLEITPEGNINLSGLIDFSIDDDL